MPTKQQLEVERIVKNAIKVRKKSKALYSEAESYLLECLGMKDFAANQNAYNTLSLKESFIVQLQAECDAGGSIIQHWKPSEIEKVRIPILPLDI